VRALVPQELDPIALRCIAGFAKKLNVSDGITATSGKWYDMIKTKLLASLAFDAATTVALPNFPLDASWDWVAPLLYFRSRGHFICVDRRVGWAFGSVRIFF
jgi:hypothetical protein